MAREFIQPAPLQDGSPMPSGKHKGTKMVDVPAKHLIYIYENNLCNMLVRDYVEANMDVLQQQAKLE